MKKGILLVGTMTMMLGIAGCAATPQKALVAQKNNERLIEAAKEEPKQGESLADVIKTTQKSYDYHFKNEKETVTITADQVPVTLPVQDTIPMYHVSSGEMDQKLVSSIFDYFFPDGEAYRFTGTDFTKEKCEERILEIEEELAKVKDDSELDEEVRQNMIENYETDLAYYKEEALPSAPEKSTLELVKVDSTLQEEQWDSLDGPYTALGLDAMSEDQKRWLSVSSTPSDRNGSRVYYCNSGEWNYDSDSGVPEEQCSESEKAAIGITPEQAQEIGDNFWKSIGQDMEMHDIELVKGYQIIGDNENEAEMKGAETYTAYRLVYTRVVNGIQLAATSSTYVPKDDTSLTWLYEQAILTIDKDGIVVVNWDYLQNVEEIVSDNVSIISFENAKAIFEQMMPLMAQGDLEQWNSDESTQVTLDLKVSDVRLGLMRVRDNGADRTGLLTPVWLFYGDCIRNFHSYMEGTQKWEDWSNYENQPWILLAVNAVDGSVINITEGY